MSEPEFHRPLALDRIGATPFEQSIAATPEECAALARRLGIPAVEQLSCAFRLARRAEGRIVAEGDIAARLVRVCVVTLDEFPVALRERFRVAFVPEGQENEDPDPESDDEIPYAGAAVDLGEAVAEQLALTLDPYPHKPGAALPEVGEAEQAESPFAALARRRQG